MRHHFSPADDTPALFLWRQLLRAGRRYVLLAVSCSVLAGLCGIGAALWLGQALANLQQRDLLALLLAGFLLTVLVRALLNYMGESNSARASAAIRGNLRQLLFRALMERGPIALGSETSGSLTTLLMEKVEAIDAYASRYLSQLSAALIIPFAALLIIGSFDVTSALIVLGGGLLLPLLLGLFGFLTARASRAQLQALTRMGALFADRLRNLTLLRTFSAAAREQAHLAQTAETFRARTMAVLRLAFLSASAMDIVQAAALVALALHLYGAGMALAPAITILLLALEFFVPLRTLSASYHDRATALNAASDIQPWLVNTVPLYAEGRRPAPTGLRSPSIELLKVSYTYPGRSEPALQDFSLRVEGGELLALTGPSGSGKSTILHLLLGFMAPTQGMLVLAQQPLHLIDPTQRGAVFAYVSQRTQLFHGTLADNIRLGRPDADEAVVQTAVKAARLDELLAELPHGLDTVIGERGFGLSGGQAQRVALARAFLRQAPVLLLDEPTTGLDADTAAELLETIKLLARERTVIMATHDPAALAIAERIVRVGGRP